MQDVVVAMIEGMLSTSGFIECQSIHCKVTQSNIETHYFQIALKNKIL
jgi:hypothetical protein